MATATKNLVELTDEIATIFARDLPEVRIVKTELSDSHIALSIFPPANFVTTSPVDLSFMGDCFHLGIDGDTVGNISYESGALSIAGFVADILRSEEDQAEAAPPLRAIFYRWLAKFATKRADALEMNPWK